MLNEGVTCLPIVDEQRKPTGIVTWRDLLRWSATAVGCQLDAPLGEPEVDRRTGGDRRKGGDGDTVGSGPSDGARHAA
jgi:CBS domain-containing protein